VHSFNPALVVRNVSKRESRQVRRHGDAGRPQGQRRVHQDGRLRLPGDELMKQASFSVELLSSR
jgi:hypothetical protein